MALSRVGVVIPQVGPWHGPSGLAEQFRWAEDVGYDVAYTYDHLTHPTVPGEFLGDGFVALTAAAAVTERIDIGTLVASATLHSPVALARLAATLDDVSGGRLVLGLGAGSRLCANADRGEQPGPREMFERFRDVTAGYRAVFDGATDWQGETRSFAGLETAALPDGGGAGSAPYLMLAAHGPKALALTAQYADAWNTYGGPGSTSLDHEEFWESVATQVARFERACAERDRDPGALRRSLLLGFGTVRPTADVATYVEVAERAGDLGFDEIVVYGPYVAGRQLSGGDDFRSDPAVHEQAIARIRG